ncbi:MAG TPA: FliM/FliN family flagellar motor switch protein [Clostridia bacterium]|nr:FliM/FliN family flagellar motor switch protein [Clostridia bacterium]
MEKILNQEEIDAMFRAARGDARTPVVHPADVVACNFRQAGQVGKDQLRAISMLHEIFARNLTHSLGAYLRVVFEVTLVSVEQLTYREFLSCVAEIAYLASYRLPSLNATAALQLDLSLAFPIIDLLLGGQGKPEAVLREVTEIEEQIMEGVVKIICRELQTAWQPLGLDFVFDQRQQATQMQRLMPPDEMTLSLSFEIKMPQARGSLNLVFPAVVSTALRKLSRDWAYQKPKGTAEAAQQLRRTMLGCPFPVQLGMAQIPVKLRDVLSLRPGQVLPLKQRADEPALLIVSGCNTFTANVVRNGLWRAAQIRERIHSAAEHRKEV